jgi:hypothetical protein
VQDARTVCCMGNPRSAFGVSIGDRVELLRMSHDPAPVAVGTHGTVDHLCDTPGLEQIGVRWDDGRSLSLLPGIDRWRLL